MVDRNEFSLSAVRELEELIALGEQSSRAIDSMVEALGRLKVRIAFISVVIYFLIVASLWFVLELKQVSDFLRASHLIATPAALLGIACMLILVYWLSTKFKELQVLARDIKFERRVLQRVVSLIDQQMRRVNGRAELSPVALATYEIRIIRMDRTNVDRASVSKK